MALHDRLADIDRFRLMEGRSSVTQDLATPSSGNCPRDMHSFKRDVLNCQSYYIYLQFLQTATRNITISGLRNTNKRSANETLTSGPRNIDCDLRHAIKMTYETDRSSSHARRSTCILYYSIDLLQCALMGV